MTNHHYDNSERLEGVSEQDWREATLLSENNQLAGNNEALIDNINRLLFSPI